MRVTALPFLALAVLALAGCGSAPRSAQTPASGSFGKATAEGGPQHSIGCAGANWAGCYEQAAAACGDKGYVIVGHGSTDAPASAGAGGGGKRAAVGSARRTLLIECREWSPR